MDILSSRRVFLRSAAAAAGGALMTLPEGACSQAPSLTPEAFGARGDGVTNDSAAFARLARAVNAAGGGTVSLRKATYIVGGQTPGSDPRAVYTYDPVEILTCSGCTRPVVIRGNGATLRCAEGLRYGLFERDGRPARRPLPYYGPGVATPYHAMIRVERCSGGVEISDLELDGNLPRLRIGGEFGDQGRQIPAVGILLQDNSGPEVIRDVHTHHHGLDGLLIDGLDAPAAGSVKRLIQRVRSEYNGRQGVSIVGGRGYAFERCQFNHTGRSAVMSAPGAGVDIEAEGHKKNRDFSFSDCEFVNNAGGGFLADSGDSEGATCTRCTFVGTTAYSAWPLKPRMRFSNCRFVGAIVHAYGDADPTRAAQFIDCTFLDDPALSPTGKVFVAAGPIADLSDGKNVLFRRCRFRLTHRGLLPWSWFAIYEDCTMSQASPQQAFPKGKYRGTSTITGKVDLYGTAVQGTLTLNGERITRTQLGGNPW